MTRGRGAGILTAPSLMAVLMTGLMAGLMTGVLAACGSGESAPTAAPEVDGAQQEVDHGSGHGAGHGTDQDAASTKPGPLRAGERRATVTMPAAYTPSAPTGVGTDDYRCFLLDPGLEQDAWLTGTHVLPGTPEAVHHVILFRVPPAEVEAAEETDDADPGEGWTCFGGTGIPRGAGAGPGDAGWLGAWAPGGKESLVPQGYGVDLPAGSRIVMQVHYNLLAEGATEAEDVSSTQFRWRPADADVTELGTFLLPAPVELPCRPGHGGSELCSRDAALEDAKARFGTGPGQVANLLHVLCGDEVPPGETTSCTRTVDSPMTILGAAGHMHLLGREIRLEVNPGRDDARTVLDIPVWDFDDQRARPVEPVTVGPGDEIRVTCRHDQSLRDELPAFADQEERYVIWGDGTTDEMCLGILQVARP